MRRLYLTAALALLIASPARAQDEQPIKVPFDTIKTQHIVVMLKINGKGPYRLIFDTGAPFTLINNKIAKDSGVLPKDSPAVFPLLGNTYKVKSMELGGVKLENTQTVIMDHPTVKAIDEAVGPVEGIVGLSFFGRYRVTIDYQAKEMTFVPVNFTPPDALKNMMAKMSSSGAPKKAVLAPAGQWGFTVAKDAKDEEAGVTVEHVVAGSAVAKAGLKAGDRLLTIDGRWTDSVVDCFAAAASVRPGTGARVVVRRDGKEMELTVQVQPGL
jgi:hypothetical protein